MVGNFSLLGLQRHPAPPRWSLPGADPKMGRLAVKKHGCGGCHIIPGVNQASGRVGPSLEDFAAQIYVAGILPNTPENLVEWIANPQHIAPGSAMPDLEVSKDEARDIAAFLYESS
ncbi:MAG: cytochrome C [Deltaproteobacteria bacterium]|nr:cytochrome C [Deltaproteobacteria bacterium]